MKEKNTKELESVLGSTHVKAFDAYCKENKESMLSEKNAFYTYCKELFREKGISQQMIF